LSNFYWYGYVEQWRAEGGSEQGYGPRYPRQGVSKGWNCTNCILL